MNSVSRTASERGKSAQRRCTSERSCTDKNQNSNWRMCQRSVGMATNSASRTASERGKSAQTRCTAERSCTDKNQNSNWRMCQRSVGKAMNSVSRTASEARQVSANVLHIRAQLHGQEPKQQLADVPKRRREGNELGQPNSIRTRASQRKDVAQPCAVARTRTKTATGGCAKEASGRQRTRSAEKHQNAASQQKALHIRAQLHGQEPKKQLADVPKRRREGNELGQPKSIRARQGSRMRGENVPESQHEKKSLFLGFYSDPSALNLIRRSATRRTLTNSIISYLGSGEERAAHCMSEMAMYPHNMHGLSK